MIGSKYETIKNENDKMVILVDKSASIQYGAMAFRHCILD